MLNQPPESVCQIFDCQSEALADWVGRFNSEGVPGLRDRPRTGAKKRLKPEFEDAFRQRVLAGPKAEDGIHTFRLLDLQLILKNEFQAEYKSLPGVWELSKRLGLSHLMPRPYNPKGDPVEQEAFKKTLPAGPALKVKNTPGRPSPSGAWMKCGAASTAR